MIRPSTTVLVVLLVPAISFARTPDIAELDEYIGSAREAWEVPGLAVAILKDDNVVLAKGYGVREHGKADAADADTLFAIASNTKAFTAATLAMLVEDGKLKWKDRVQEHLPYFRLHDSYVSAEMRVDDLLCHRSGLGKFSGDLLWYGTPYSPEEVIRRTKHLPPAGPFRAHYGYSNLMFLAAGEIVTKISGEPWPDFVRERILQPLGMNRTTMTVRKLEVLGNFATPHKPTPDGLRPLAWQNWDTMAAGGGIISSVNDMTKWLRVQMNRGRIDDKRRLFSETSSRQMWAPQTIIPVSDSSREHYPTTHFRAYGLGWSLADYKGRKTVSHGGGYDGMFSRVLMVPEERLGIVVLTNSMTGISTALTYRIVDAYLGGDQREWSAEGLKRNRKKCKEFYDRIAKTTTPRAENTKPSHALDAYAGTYTGKLYGDATICIEKDNLVLRLLPNKDLVADLTHLHYDTFVIHWRNEFAWFSEGTAQFLLNAAGDVAELRIEVPNDDFWFHELELIRK